MPPVQQLPPDPRDPNNRSIAAGEVQSKGVEFDLGGEIAAGLCLSAAYAFTDAKVTQDNAAATGVSLVGRQLPNVPRHSANLLLVQAFKLGGSYAIGKAWKFSLDVDNVFDETFYSSSRAQRWVLPGNGRKVTLAGQYKF